MPERDAGAKLRIYHTIYRLNLSFANIVAHCRALGESEILSPKFTRLYQSYAQELQAEINEDVVAIMDEVELRDMHRFGKARIAREKELRDPDDVFIHAEERRKEIARQKGKVRPPKRKKISRPRSGSISRRKRKTEPTRRIRKAP
jgi:sensor histidine kinase regulating citrate/malate metabolism